MTKLAKRIAGAVALTTLSFAAQAADLPSRSQPPVAPVYVPAFTWTGFYVGGQLGWGQTSTKYTAGARLIPGAAAIALPTLEKNGILGGALAGYNYQVGQYVIGAEADISFLTTGRERYTAISGDYITAKTNWVGSARARLGYALDNTLLYITGGLAFASPESTVAGTGYSFGAGSSTRWGWTLGAGVDYAMTKNWIVGLEYRYTQYESDTYTYPVGVGRLGIAGFKSEPSTNQVTARMSYKF